MFRSSSAFDRLLEKATSHLLLEPDWDAILNICDTIRSGDTPPKYAVAAIKKKFYVENPHVVLYALMVIESCVKNCGNLIHDEVCTKQFMEELRELVKLSKDENVKQKILEILQTWGMAFRNQSKYRIVTDTLDLMKAEGWKFPPVREAEAMFEADIAPDWAEGDVCHRCRVAFGMLTRQHHCRGCGQVFCGKCSAKTCPIPKFGLEKEVRVCDPCFDKFGPTEESMPSTPKKTPKVTGEHIPPEYLASHLAQQNQPTAPGAKRGKSEAEIKEEEDLQLALALSQSEAEEKEKFKLRQTAQILSSAKPAKTTVDEKPPEMNDDELAPELMRYLNRNYWEQQQKEQSNQNTNGSEVGKSVLKKSSIKSDPDLDYSPVKGITSSAVKVSEASLGHPTFAPVSTLASMLARASDDELDEFVTTLKTQLEIFVNRMKSNSSRGRPIGNDSSVQTLFMNTMAMHSKLLKYIQDKEDARVYYEGLQDKLTQVRDARAALDALREEDRERKRREAEEIERLRQIQMREKLEVMRQKKQEYLQYQRQLALQKMQEQEREMILRQEQAKQHYMMMQQAAMAGQQQTQAVYHPGLYGAPGMMQGYQPFMPQGQYPQVAPQPGGPQMGMAMGYAPPPPQPQPPQPLPPVTSPSDVPQPGQYIPPQQGAFNMQAMGAALPGYGPMAHPNMQPPQMGPGPQQVPMQQFAMGSPQHQQAAAGQHQHHGQPMQGQGPQPVPQQQQPYDHQELISFD